MDDFDPPPKTILPPLSRKGRGATLNMVSRFHAEDRERVHDDWWLEEEEGALDALKTTLTIDTSKTVIARNDSPDIPFDRSINPYRGCEHGCIYCYARPSHAYLGLSPGLDFETRLVYKPDAAERLREELARPAYGKNIQPIALGMNTDAWQPVERKLQVTRGVLEALRDTHHPFGTVTKSALILRDLDIFAAMAERKLAQAAVTITTLDPKLARILEPRAASPQRRLEVIRELAQAGVPVAVSVAPVIPALTDHEMENILEQAVDAGACAAWYTLLRLPHEVSPLFRDWLATHYPDRAAHVMSLVQQMRGGKDYEAEFRTRMRGEGLFADLISQRFKLAMKRLNLQKHRERWPLLDCTSFIAPKKASPQAELF